MQSLIKFKVSWEEDDATFRIIEVVSSQTFYEFHTCIKKSLQFPEALEAVFYVSDAKGKRGMAVSSLVEKNLRDAPALSMKKTPVAALIADPEQRFIYECQHPRGWTFQVEIISVSPFYGDSVHFPKCIKSEGISPVNFGMVMQEKDGVVEIEEKYDLNNKEGFGDEGDEDLAGEEGTEPEEAGGEDAIYDT